jgi:predicted Zn-dependent protease
MSGRTASLVCLLAASVAAQPNEREVALGRQLAAEFERSVRIVDSPAALAYVRGIGQRLTSAPYTFHIILDDPTLMHEVAAFPGGFFYVPAALILEAQDEDEFAGVLARAIAKVESSGPARPAIAGRPMLFLGGPTGYAVPQGQLAIPVGMLQEQRKRELEADRAAVRTIASAGWNPEALARYIERVQPPQAAVSGAFSVLPSRAERLQGIASVIVQLPPRHYEAHDGLQKTKEDLLPLTRPSRPNKAPPSLMRH